MKLRDLLNLVLALFVVSALIGLGALFYLRTHRSTPVAQNSLGVDVPTPSEASTSSPATPLPSVPPLATPTVTNTSAPTLTPSPTAPPTPTPTPTLTPTPTPVPAARLANAYRSKRNGDYARACDEFALFLQAPDLSAAEVAEARFEIGVCALLNGDLEQARKELSRFIEQYPEHHRLNDARFHLATALAQLGDHQAAIDQYQTYLLARDTLPDLVYQRIGDSQLALHNYQAAAQAYEAAMAATNDLTLEYDLREKIGLILQTASDYAQAIEWFSGIIERSENVYRLARIWYLIGQTYRLEGQEDKALEAFGQAIAGDPRPGYAHAALVALVDAGVPVSEFRRGLINYYAGSYSAAVAAFYRYIETTPDYDSDAHYYVAQSLASAGSADLAVQECDRALNLFTSTIPHWGDLWLIKARALDTLGQSDRAVDTYRQFARDYPEHALSPQALWEAGQLLEREEEFAQAAEVFSLLVDQHTNSELAPAAGFRSGLSRYRAGDAETALTSWRRGVDQYPNTEGAIQSRYWLGKVLWAQGSSAEGRSWLEALAEDYPRNYYGLRAAHLLNAGGRTVEWPTASAATLVDSEQTDEQEVALWFANWAQPEVATVLAQTSPALTGSPHYGRAVELAALGLASQAVQELDLLRAELERDPIALYQLSLLARSLDLYAPSLRAALDVIALAPETSVLDMPTLVQQLAFPVYFEDLVLSECATYDLDPLLMFALIRQESVFDAHITSWAGAVGLAQIMPSTGEWIAEMMPWTGYSEKDLERGYISVKFGAWFLARILQSSGGSVMTALAGYNGGPANGARWMQQAGGDPDLFVEIITRSEPRLYVREIYRHYDVYARLYAGK